MVVSAIKVEGQANLERTMGRAQANLEHLDTTDAAHIIAARSTSTAPRRTGRLAAGTRVLRTEQGASIENAVVYAVPIHWGRPAHNIEANPWISRAAAETEHEWSASIEHQGQKVCDTVRGI